MTRTIVAMLAALLAGGLAQAEDSTYIYVLGIAQDAGYPQAGCYQPHCMPGWQDKSLRRTASSVAVIDTASRAKYLFDATPDLPDQLYRLHAEAPDDEYSLDGVFLTHAHIGHYVGLMHFGHEVMGAHDVPVYAMPRMHEFLSTNGPWDQLVRYENIRLHQMSDAKPIEFSERLTVTPFRVPHRDEYSETVGFRIDGPNKSAVFIPDIDKWQDWETDIRDVVRDVDYALVDATFYGHGELARDMSAIKHPFIEESMALFEDLTDEQKARVIFIHLNHSNPAMRDGSEQRATVENNGFRIAHEGMRLEL